MAHLLYHNLYTNSDTKELKPQRLRLLKPHFLSLRWPNNLNVVSFRSPYSCMTDLSHYNLYTNFKRQELEQLEVREPKAQSSDFTVAIAS